MTYDVNVLFAMMAPLKIKTGATEYTEVRYLSVDSRTITSPEKTIFFALRGDLHDGHDYIGEAYRQGVRHFVVDKNFTIPKTILLANYCITEDVSAALQMMAAAHRRSFPGLKTIGITGSNGKTTVKEWLGSMLFRHNVIRSPKSYNSQTGVPLSLWLIEEEHNLGIFEAGISTTGEMEKLEKMIRPQIGIFTNIGDAHATGFRSLEEKVDEKLKLFQKADFLIYEEDDLLISERIQYFYPKINKLSWGVNGKFLRLTRIDKEGSYSRLFLEKDHLPFEITVPFSDEASIQNSMHCITLLLFLQYTIGEIQQKVQELHNLAMRLELKPGENNNIIINDTYNADLQSFDVALSFLHQHAAGREKVVFLTVFDQSGKDRKQFLQIVANLMKDAGVQRVFTIGEELLQLPEWLQEEVIVKNFMSTEDAIANVHQLFLKDAAILVKGSRRFGLDALANVLSEKWHEAVLETDLQAVAHNLRYFSSWLKADTGIIAVIKASAYGSGSHELAALLEYSKVDYLAVAYVDEGVALRRQGIQTPIMVLNSSAEQWSECLQWNLEPEIYSLDYIQKIWAIEGNETLKVHIKLDTGMNRLGLLPEDIAKAVGIIRQWPANIIVASVFTHLVSTEDEKDDPFSHQQVELYEKMYHQLCEVLPEAPAKHVLNTAGIRRFPQYHFDYVRLGLGLYGIDMTATFSGFLEKAHTLKAKVIQIKNVYRGHTVGYNRRGKIGMHGKVAVINIGYADGFMRMAGNGKYFVRIREENFPVIGNINMDLTIVHIGENENIRVGDEVEIFGKNNPVETLAEACQTIPYEIISRISPRVKRVYTKG